MSKTNRANLDSQSSPAPASCPAALPTARTRTGGRRATSAGDVPWDSGITPPEVVAVIESGRVRARVGAGPRLRQRCYESLSRVARIHTSSASTSRHAALHAGAAGRARPWACRASSAGRRRRLPLCQRLLPPSPSTSAASTVCRRRAAFRIFRPLADTPGARRATISSTPSCQAGAADGDGTADESARPAVARDASQSPTAILPHSPPVSRSGGLPMAKTARVTQRGFSCSVV